jgi:hypothetical protein
LGHSRRSRHPGVSGSPQKQTLLGAIGMSALCH